MTSLFIYLLVKLVRFIGKIHAPYSTCLITQYDFDYPLQPGDIILTRSRGEFSNLFIKGFFKHAAIYINGDIVEAVGEGVKVTHPFDFFKRMDYFVVLRYRNINTRIISSISEQIKGLLGKKYDFTFSEEDKFYCVELITHLYEQATFNEILFNKHVINKKYISYPFDLLVHNDLKIVYYSKSLKDLREKSLHKKDN